MRRLLSGKILSSVSVTDMALCIAVAVGGWFVSGCGMNAWLLWALGVCMCFRSALALRRFSIGRFGLPAGWLLLGCGVAGLFLDMPSPWRWWFGILAFLSCFGSFVLALGVAFPLAVLLVIPAFQPFLNLFLSYPLRWLSCAFTVFFLRLCNLDVRWHETEILLGGVTVTITAACSGIEQLETMLFLGYLLAFSQQKTLLRKLGHFCMVLPALVGANTLRLTVTMLIFHFSGDWIFDPLPHQILGWLMVVCAFVLLYLLGKLFSAETVGGEKSSC